jgi:dolichol-phosphate mannosyltransferase
MDGTIHQYLQGLSPEVIEGVRPILSPHFNNKVELPHKAIVRGYSYTTMPITWRNFQIGVANLKIKKIGTRYLFRVFTLGLKNIFHEGIIQICC